MLINRKLPSFISIGYFRNFISSGKIERFFIDEDIDAQFNKKQRIWLKTIDNDFIPMQIKYFNTSSNKTFLELNTLANLSFNFKKGAELFVDSNLVKSWKIKDNKPNYKGWDVLNSENKIVGKVDRYISAGSNKMISVNCNDEKILVPLDGDFISLFDNKCKKIKIDRLNDLVIK